MIQSTTEYQKEQIKKQTYPCIKKDSQSTLIILFDSENSGTVLWNNKKYFSETYLGTDEKYHIGAYSKNWKERNFNLIDFTLKINQHEIDKENKILIHIDRDCIVLLEDEKNGIVLWVGSSCSNKVGERFENFYFDGQLWLNYEEDVYLRNI